MSYSKTQKLLHHIALSTSFMKEVTFDFEQLFLSESLEESMNQNHVFIMGLARSGTTAILNQLYSSGEFACLTYEDMPFIMAPNLWQKIYGKFIRKNKFKQERAHGDGIIIDISSPEAFEEVFWSTFEKNSRSNLEIKSVDDDLKENFQRFICSILTKDKKNRYLSKNNSNIVRLNLIRGIFPKAIILLPFRDPLQHANSLLNQHKRFCESQKNDVFIKKYMNWLGHNEFGLGYIPYSRIACEYNNPQVLDHWLEQWFLVHQKLLSDLENDRRNILLVNYEKLCENPEKIWQQITSQLSINYNIPDFVLSKKEINESYSENILKKCQILFEKLLNKSV